MGARLCATGLVQSCTLNADLQSQQWGRKICAANAIKVLCKLGGKGSLSFHAAGIGKQLLQVSHWLGQICQVHA